jgi:hypothetical protein
MHLSNRMQTPSFFHLSEMMRMHMPTLLQMRVLIHMTQRDSDLDSESVQLDARSENLDAVAEPEKRPKWEQTTLQDVGDLVGDPTDTRRNRSDFKEPPVALTTTEPLPSRHIFLV